MVCHASRHLTFVIFMVMMNSVYVQASTPNYFLPDEKNTVEIFKRTSSLVVNVSNHRYARVNFFSDDITEVPAGTGSGFVWDSSGHIVTNFHVIQGADKVVVSFGDGKTYGAKIVGVEPRKDVAVLKLDSWDRKLDGLPHANSSELQVGQKAIAIGSPFGLDQTLTTGVVSALGRSIPGIGQVTIRDMIQTDASINPGNSGGPLLDSRGYLIGMNTMIFSKSGTSAGIGFAVPVNTIKRVVGQIIKFGRVKQPALGVSVFSDDVMRQLGLEGVLIRSVIPGSGAQSAGLKGTSRDRAGNIILGDIIVAINGQKIRNYDDLYNSLENMAIGQTVEVEILRDNKRLKFSLKLTEINE